MKFRWEKKYLYWGLTAFLVIVCSIFFFILAYNYKLVQSNFQRLAEILMPFTAGVVIAYLLCPILNYFEIKVATPLLDKTKRNYPKRLPRIISIVVTLILACAFITGLFFMVIPQLVSSISGVVNNLSVYFENLKEWVIGLLDSNPSLQNFITAEFDDISKTVTDWAKNSILPRVNSIISGVTSGVFGVLNFVKNFFIGLIISIYILYSKETFFAQSKKFIFSVFGVKWSNRIIHLTRRSHKIFGGFVIGKLIDSLIIGILCFIGMSIFRMPYALLISVIIAITNFIPFFGPFIGAIPSGLLILMIDPLTSLYFMIFILALQQFDGNILGPKILGDSTGLSAFWVIFAILVSGGLFGFVGMVIGVPTFAVIYSIIVELINGRLKRHELPVETSEYKELTKIDELDSTVIYNDKDDDDIKINVFTSQKKPSSKP